MSTSSLTCRATGCYFASILTYEVIMSKEQLINLIFEFYDQDLYATVEGPNRKELERMRSTDLMSLAIDLELLGDELP